MQRSALIPDSFNRTTVKDQEQTLQELRKENFDLKLRLYMTNSKNELNMSQMTEYENHVSFLTRQLEESRRSSKDVELLLKEARQRELRLMARQRELETTVDLQQEELARLSLNLSRLDLSKDPPDSPGFVSSKLTSTPLSKWRSTPNVSVIAAVPEGYDEEEDYESGHPVFHRESYPESPTDLWGDSIRRNREEAVAVVPPNNSRSVRANLRLADVVIGTHLPTELEPISRGRSGLKPRKKGWKNLLGCFNPKSTTISTEVEEPYKKAS